MPSEPREASSAAYDGLTKTTRVESGIESTSSSSVAYSPHMALRGDAIASKAGAHRRRTVATIAGGVS